MDREQIWGGRQAVRVGTCTAEYHPVGGRPTGGSAGGLQKGHGVVAGRRGVPVLRAQNPRIDIKTWM